MQKLDQRLLDVWYDHKRQVTEMGGIDRMQWPDTAIQR